MTDAVPFKAAVEKICAYLDLDVPEFLGYCDEDEVGGFPEKWHVGSIFGVEGKILYALTRMLKPRTILEFGTSRGCSGTHFADALDRNESGRLVSIDPAPLAPDLHARERVTAIRECGERAAREWESEIDFVFEDAAHSVECTRDIIRGCLPKLAVGGLVLVHDTEHFLVGEAVSQGFREAVGDFESVLIESTDCGLGYWRKT